MTTPSAASVPYRIGGSIGDDGGRDETGGPAVSLPTIPRPTTTDLFVDAVLTAAATAGRTWRRVVLLVLTLALGPAVGVALAFLGPPAQRTFAVVQGTTQLVISVLLPFVGILLAADVRRSGATRVVPTCLATAGIAVKVAVVGLLAATVATSAAPGITPGRWDGAASLALGGLVVQVVCVLVGVGLGLLLTRPWVAFVASAAVPLGLYAVLGAVPQLHAARDWLTPYASAQHLLSGATTPLNWAQAAVVALLWGVALPALAWRRLSPSP